MMEGRAAGVVTSAAREAASELNGLARTLDDAVAETMHGGGCGA
jgi:hypothetical protein